MRGESFFTGQKGFANEEIVFYKERGGVMQWSVLYEAVKRLRREEGKLAEW